MPDLKRCAALALVVLAVGTVSASLPSAALSAPAQWSLERAAILVTAQGAVFESGGNSYSVFLPQVGLSYSLTSGMNLVAIAERDFQSHLTVGRLGARFLVSKFGQGALGLGADAVFYADDGRARLGLRKDTSWEASVHGEWPVARYAKRGDEAQGPAALFLCASASRDVQNELSTLRLGLRYQLVGGR